MPKKTRVVSTKVDSAEYEAIRRFAKANKMTVSKLVRLSVVSILGDGK